MGFGAEWAVQEVCLQILSVVEGILELGMMETTIGGWTYVVDILDGEFLGAVSAHMKLLVGLSCNVGGDADGGLSGVGP